MSYDLLLTRSITHAQRITEALERAGIAARYLRAPMGLSGKGCGYAVRIGGKHLQAAVGVLRPLGLEPVRVVRADGQGGYQELSSY